jgi:SAM-dependent methyltransferase
MSISAEPGPYSAGCQPRGYPDPGNSVACVCLSRLGRPSVPAHPGDSELVEVNPPGQYADDRNLRARQRLWQCQVPFFDIAAWVLNLAGLVPGMRVLDAGCGNGIYLRALRERRVNVAGCDLSLGMLRGVTHSARINADVTALPIRADAFEVVLAAHLLDLVPDRQAAARELRRVLAPGGTCVAVTNGAQHLRSLRTLIERAARASTPGWRIPAPTRGTFTADNAAAQLGVAFQQVTCVRPAGAGPVVITDASVAADYVASLAEHYQPDVARPWSEVAEDVREQVQAVIDAENEFLTAGDMAAFVCR